MDLKIFEAVDDYINSRFAREDEALAKARQSIVDEKLPLISISENQGKYLHMLARLVRPQKILEMGTLGGYSTIWLARALQPGGQLISLELDQHHADVARANINRAGLGGCVTIRLGKALEQLPLLKQEQAGPFDFIFIDADKEPYAEYFEWALQLARPGTLIIADNVVREGKILEEHSSDSNVIGVTRLMERMAKEQRVTATVFQTIGSKGHDGMAMAIVNEAVA